MNNTTTYIVREKWPRCKKWESIRKHETKESALTDFRKRTTVAPDDSYKITGAPKGKIVVQCVEINIIAEGTI
ncbi:MAG TPA: hypothetical protein VFQ43_14535 [Nitrososphaera sp.]|nr:hypothetical protein [Nitrososphaera sp.]